ncbi:NAD-dependent epimerase/dehydratase family protein [Cellulophaga sp. E16_2]|uniref:NAD-dependent epimerase/dehydratase family protein n=1 Tax=Cellulophaga sp. E16_2 TaxID=2789297 RepID=UPI001A9232E7|nr:NAD-dependent epimerase/dehydratase family protein [Cellulophaga sp. E16_2]MBO0590768.1 NAD-dependent epimerase/dehydratase family protein [Cellulophaga sp. E16_2]
MILVTGGTGLVGSHLLFELTKTNTVVRAIHREHSDLKQVEKIFSYYTKNYQEQFNKIEWVLADLNDVPALDIAFENITHVYHCAALISFDPRNYDKLFKINCEGTANIVNISLAKKVKKLAYISSIATIGQEINSDTVNEDSDWNAKDANVYALTKHDAEIEVWRGSQEGLPSIILNPGVILGPGFWDSGSGTIFKTAAKGYAYYPPSGTGFIGVTDVVNLLILGMNSEINKERYIAIAENNTYKEILCHISKKLDLRPPNKELKKWQLSFLWRLDWLASFFSNKERKLTKNSTKSLQEQKKYDNQKIKTAFSYTFEPIDKVLDFCTEHFKKETS